MKRYVYFFQAADGLIKIGQSGDPAARLKALHRGPLVEKMASKASLSTSQLVRRALDEYAVRYGFGINMRPDFLVK